MFKKGHFHYTTIFKKKVLRGIFSKKQFSRSILGHFQYTTIVKKKVLGGIFSIKQFSKSILGHFQYTTIFKETFRDRMRPVKQQLCQVGLMICNYKLQIAGGADLQINLQIEKKTRISNHNEQI